MSRILFISCLMLVVSASRAQVSVHFTLNVAPLAREAQFTPGATTRIFVRGSFNDWKGTDCELFAAADGQLYQGTFELPGNIGDSRSISMSLKRKPGRSAGSTIPTPRTRLTGTGSWCWKGRKSPCLWPVFIPMPTPPTSCF